MSKLNELCINITDGEHGTVIDDNNGRFYLLSNKNIVNNEIVITNGDRKINKEVFEKINKRTVLEKNDILISTVGTLGKTAIIKNDIINYVFQRSVGIIKVDSKKINPYYLKYQIDSPAFQKRIIKLSKGAIQKCLYIDDLRNLEIMLPSMAIQNRIVEILKTIDDKITNNNHINDNLEYKVA